MKNKSNHFFLGIDIGSATTKAVIIDEKKNIIFKKVIDTDPDHKRGVDKLLELANKQLSTSVVRMSPKNVDIDYCIGTGYGRNNIFCANTTVTEIACHARGVHYYYPEAKTIIDIGGQDSKVIRIDENGGVIDFAMNEKCAAGTGRFLEVISGVLEVAIDEIGPISLATDKKTRISSMCTVFAESEVISKIAEGVEKDSILNGVHSSIAFRVLALGRRIGITPPIAFTGGVAKNIGIVKMVDDQMEGDAGQIFIPPQPQIIGALGASLLALDEYTVKNKKVDHSYRWPVDSFNDTRGGDPVKHHKSGPVIGWTDLSVPVELLVAAQIGSIRIRGDIEKGASSDQYIQTYSCAFIKNSLSALLEESEQYQHLNGIITTNCCTATEKMCDILESDDMFSNLFVYPITVPRKSTDYAVAYMKQNIIHLKKAVEKAFKVSISDEKLRTATEKVNHLKCLLLEYSLLLSKKNFPDAAVLVAVQMERLFSLMDHVEDFADDLKKEIDILKNTASLEKRGPNIMISGSIIPDMGFYELFNGLNCQLAYNGTSSGSKFSHSLVDLKTPDIYSALARRCLYAGYGPRMMDSISRMNEIKIRIDEYQIDAVVFNISKFCAYYTFEAVVLKQYCDQWGIPLLVVETDFTNEGSGQLQTRVEAFIETLNGKVKHLKTI